MAESAAPQDLGRAPRSDSPVTHVWPISHMCDLSHKCAGDRDQVQPPPGPWSAGRGQPKHVHPQRPRCPATTQCFPTFKRTTPQTNLLTAFHTNMKFAGYRDQVQPPPRPWSDGGWQPGHVHLHLQVRLGKVTAHTHPGGGAVLWCRWLMPHLMCIYIYK